MNAASARQIAQYSAYSDCSRHLRFQARGQRIVPALIRGLVDTHADVQWLAASELRTLADARAIEPLRFNIGEAERTTRDPSDSKGGM